MAVALGDPAAMRSEAYGLRAQAEALASLAQQLQARIEGLTFEGPAVDRFRAAMIERYHEALRLAGELQDLADYVFRAAARVEAQIAELQRQEALRRQRELELQEYSVTRIVLDPTELAGAASELRGTAGEYTSLGTQAASCNCHCMPADVAATVDAATASIRAQLSQLAVGLAAEGAQLAWRAGVPQDGAASTAISAASGSGVGTQNGGVTLVIGGDGGFTPGGRPSPSAARSVSAVGGRRPLSRRNDVT